MLEIFEANSYPATPSLLEPDLRNGIMYPLIDGGTEVRKGSLFVDLLSVGSQTWVHTVAFSVVDYNTVSWASGAINFADGTNVSISSGDTGNIGAKTYIYYDGTGVLKTTTDYTVPLGNTNVLLAIAEPDTDTSGKAVITTLGATGTTIDGDKIVTGKIQSINGNTFFDLNNNLLQISNDTNTTIIDGKGLVSSANFPFSSVSGSGIQGSTSTSFNDLTGLSISFTLARAQQVSISYMVVGGATFVELNNTNDAAALFQLDVDGSNVGPEQRLYSVVRQNPINSPTTVVNYYTNASYQTVVSLGSGSHTIKLKMKSSNGSYTANCNRSLSYLTYFKMGA